MLAEKVSLIDSYLRQAVLAVRDYGLSDLLLWPLDSDFLTLHMKETGGTQAQQWPLYFIKLIIVF